MSSSPWSRLSRILYLILNCNVQINVARGSKTFYQHVPRTTIDVHPCYRCWIQLPRYRHLSGRWCRHEFLWVRWKGRKMVWRIVRIAQSRFSGFDRVALCRVANVGPIWNVGKIKCRINEMSKKCRNWMSQNGLSTLKSLYGLSAILRICNKQSRLKTTRGLGLILNIRGSICTFMNVFSLNHYCLEILRHFYAGNPHKISRICAFCSKFWKKH